MERLSSAQQLYAQPQEAVRSIGMDLSQPIRLEEVIEKIHPEALIGVSAATGAFSEKAIRLIAKYVPRPIIFPLSNPDSKSEAAPADLIHWTDGKALIATGTPFPDVVYKGKTYQIDQCNNYYIFPAIGLGVLASKARRITPHMFLAAAKRLSELSPILKNREAHLFPNVGLAKEMAKQLALVIGMQAQKEGVAEKSSEAALQKAIDQIFWEPAYVKSGPAK